MVTTMRSMPFDPLGRPLSRLALGTLWFTPDRLAEVSELLDAWVELGGNTIDTAHVYEKGDAERALGQWLRARPGVRERLVIISKGAHPDGDRVRVTPEDITSDLEDTLERLGGPVDLYLLHRDDPSKPVGPLVEILDEHRRAGRLHAYGASNWTPERIDEANAYASANGLAPFCASSTHLSLAKQYAQQWPGAISATDPAIREWHERTQLPLLAWSAQASGFFAGRFARDRPADPTIEAVYFSDDNWERLDRARTLADRLGATANEVALAWVLAQRFPVQALIGPRTVDELRGSINATELTLSDEDVAWLNLEDA
jgi:aryl-alcohol dehydrogenase-like predicted oxidoreductase